MVTSELSQSNHVTNRQCYFGQSILMEGIPTGFKLKTLENLLKLLEKQNQSAVQILSRKCLSKKTNYVKLTNFCEFNSRH